MGQPLPDMDLAITQAIAQRSASVVITQEDRLVDIVHPQSRTEFETRTRRRRKIKVGDFLSTVLDIPRRAAGVVYDSGHIGICAPSADALAIAATSDATTYNIFETEIHSNESRAVLVPHTIRPAAEQTIELASVRDFLGI